jgi:hypothetical protein
MKPQFQTTITFRNYKLNWLQIKTDPGIPMIYSGFFLFNDKYVNNILPIHKFGLFKKIKKFWVEIQIVLF